MSPTIKNYNLLCIPEIRMEMNGLDGKVKIYNKTLNLKFDDTAGYVKLVLNGEALDFDFRDDENEGYIEYHFTRHYQRANWIISEKIFIKIFDNKSKPEILFNLKFHPASGFGNSYLYYVQDNGIADARGFLYKKGGCMNKYHLNIVI
jgi:hypothetical protein